MSFGGGGKEERVHHEGTKYTKSHVPARSVARTVRGAMIVVIIKLRVLRGLRVFVVHFFLLSDGT
jgi:hypothetical protein